MADIDVGAVKKEIERQELMQQISMTGGWIDLGQTVPWVVVLLTINKSPILATIAAIIGVGVAMGTMFYRAQGRIKQDDQSGPVREVAEAMAYLVVLIGAILGIAGTTLSATGNLFFRIIIILFLWMDAFPIVEIFSVKVLRVPSLAHKVLSAQELIEHYSKVLKQANGG